MTDAPGWQRRAMAAIYLARTAAALEEAACEVSEAEPSMILLTLAAPARSAAALLTITERDNTGLAIMYLATLGRTMARADLFVQIEAVAKFSEVLRDFGYSPGHPQVEADERWIIETGEHMLTMMIAAAGQLAE